MLVWTLRNQRGYHSPSLKGMVLAVCLVITVLKNCLGHHWACLLPCQMQTLSSVYFLLVWRGDMQAQKHRYYVDYPMHVCNIFVSLPACTVVLAPHTVTGWGGSKQQYLCCHDNSEDTPCFLHPTPPTCSVHSKALERGAGATMQWGLTWAVKHQLLSLSSSTFVIIIIWQNQNCYPFIFLARKAV